MAGIFAGRRVAGAGFENGLLLLSLFEPEFDWFERGAEPMLADEVAGTVAAPLFLVAVLDLDGSFRKDGDLDVSTGWVCVDAGGESLRENSFVRPILCGLTVTEKGEAFKDLLSIVRDMVNLFIRCPKTWFHCGQESQDKVAGTKTVSRDRRRTFGFVCLLGEVSCG